MNGQATQVSFTQGVLPPATFPSTNNGVGGTSGGGGGAGQNVLSANIGGANLNYDIGPNTEQFADSAYNYLDNSFAEDSELLGGTIAGSQSFLSNFAAPIENFDTQVLPSMFGTLQAQNQSLGMAAIGAESNVAQASIASSQASAAEASSGGGGCFITTAVCEERGEADDCETLTTLRAFRDGHMMKTAESRKLVALYYRVAPLIVARIRERADRSHLLAWIHDTYIVAAKRAIECLDFERAQGIYTSMLVNVAREV